MSESALGWHPSPPKLVVLDREGVLLQHITDHIVRFEDVRPIDGALDAVGALARRGVMIAVATNQSCINTGLVGSGFVDAVNARIAEQLRARDARVLGFYVCPHRRDEGCACRKPQPGLVEAAIRQAGVLPGQTWMVGDHDVDVLAGVRAGCAESVHVLSGRQPRPSQFATAVFSDLSAMVRRVLDALTNGEKSGGANPA